MKAIITHLPIFTVTASSQHVYISLKQLPLGQNLNFMLSLFFLYQCNLNFTRHNTFTIAFNVIVTLLPVDGEVRPYELPEEYCAFFVLLVSNLISGTTLN